jgi:hypothetical protein
MSSRASCGSAVEDSGVGRLAVVVSGFWSARRGTLNVGAFAGGGQAAFLAVGCEGFTCDDSACEDFACKGTGLLAGPHFSVVADFGGIRRERAAGDPLLSSSVEDSLSSLAFLASDSNAASISARIAPAGPLRVELSPPEGPEPRSPASIKPSIDINPADAYPKLKLQITYQLCRQYLHHYQNLYQNLCQNLCQSPNQDLHQKLQKYLTNHPHCSQHQLYDC